MSSQEAKRQSTVDLLCEGVNIKQTAVTDNVFEQSLQCQEWFRGHQRGKGTGRANIKRDPDFPKALKAEIS